MEMTQGQQTYAEVILKAWEDVDFKNELIANPVDTIEKFTGKKMNLQSGQKVVVQDETDNSNLYFKIPAQVNIDELELTEEQLEQVAGGVTPLAPVVIVFYCCTALSAGIAVGKCL